MPHKPVPWRFDLDGSDEIIRAADGTTVHHGAMKAIVDMIDNCADVPRSPDSLPMMIRRAAARYLTDEPS